MYNEQRLTVDSGNLTVGASPVLVDADDLGFKFDVLEDNMYVEAKFQGGLLGGVANAVVQLALALTDDLGAAVPDLTIDATGATNYTNDVIYRNAVLFAAASAPVQANCRRMYRLNKGTYRIQLFGNAISAGAATVVIDGTACVAFLSVETSSNHNVVAANSNLKRQGAY